MNFFIRNNLLIWILGGLLIITLSVLGSMIYHTWSQPEKVVSLPGCNSSCQMLFSNLELNPEQQDELDRILDHFRDSSTLVVSEMRQLRQQLMDELRKDIPDTLQILSLSEKLG
ncbi:MAG: periplasmic heavy metal sensor, partial [Bacteroidales bacterium]|nr:periplasmic heavy metal sensor [Bacteroidales bacterium]